MIAAALSIQDPRERPAEHAGGRRRAAPALRRARAATCCRSSPCGTTSASGSARCRRTSSAGCAAPSTSTTCACGSGRTCSASCARSPATSASAPAAPRPATPTTSTRPCSPGCCRTSACATATGASSAGPAAPTFAIARGLGAVTQAAAVGDGRRARRDQPAVGPPGGDDRAGVGRARSAPTSCKRSYGEPRWDEQRGAAVTTETVTLYGLPIVTGRTVPYDRVDRGGRPRAVHPPRPRRGRVVDAPRVRRPQPGVPSSGCSGMEARVRRGDLLDDDELQRVLRRAGRPAT